MLFRTRGFFHQRHWANLLIGTAGLWGGVSAGAEALPRLAVDPALVGAAATGVLPDVPPNESAAAAETSVQGVSPESAAAAASNSTQTTTPIMAAESAVQAQPLTPEAPEVVPVKQKNTAQKTMPAQTAAAPALAVRDENQAAAQTTGQRTTRRIPPPVKSVPPAASPAASEKVAVKTLPALSVDPALLGEGAPARLGEEAGSVMMQAIAGDAGSASGGVNAAGASAALPLLSSKKSSGKASKRSSRAATQLTGGGDSSTHAAKAPLIALTTAVPAASEAVAPGQVRVLPALSVDPALLAGEAVAKQSGVLQAPPEVAVQPVLAPTYSAHLAAGVLPGPRLKASPQLLAYETAPDDVLPTFITADNMAGQTDIQMVAQGNVDLRRRGAVLKSDKLTHWQENDEVEAEGHVDLVNEGAHVVGPRMRMKLGENTGFFEQPAYQISQPKVGSPPVIWTVGEVPEGDLTVGQGEAARIDFEGKGKYRLSDATYSTCTPAPGSSPDWFARTANLRMDYEAQVGVASNATIYFKDVPILYTPWMSFSLNNERKSGLLTPTMGSSSRGGVEFTQPFYWNIAPNMDATIAPRLIAKRGVMWTGEYRYLEPEFSGIFNGTLLSKDGITEEKRSAYSYKHAQNFGYGITGALDLNYASDGTYFSDFGSNSAIIAQTNLLRQGSLRYGASWWSVTALAQSYQTLQDPALPPVVTPYRRLPQFNLTANRSDLPFGAEFGFNGEYVNFQTSSSAQTNNLPEGKRSTLYPQISWPLQTAAFFVTPKVGVHATRYSLQNQKDGIPDNITRTVPIASVDSGLTFERSVSWFDRALVQTLEPRLYYLYIPVRDQSQIPNFDSGLGDFNFAQIFSENRYVGGDRINDANQLTGMVTSRLLDADSGAEILRAAFGQRVYFTTQHVGLPGEPLRTGRQTDLLGAFSGRVLPKVYVDAGAQYNTQDSQLMRFNLAGRYQPEIGKLLNAGYRYTRDQLQQVDFSGQWAFDGGWHGVGRYNYSLKDKRLVEAIAGFEYDGGCWVGRVVMQRLATQTARVNNSLLFQLELNGFANLGSNPLSLLKRAVPGYGPINQERDAEDGL